MDLFGGARGSSFFLTDEEKGKKDDDHKQLRKPAVVRRGWTPARVQPRRGLRRVMAVLLFGSLVYLFIKYIPTDVPIRDHRRPDYSKAHGGRTFDPYAVPEFRPELRRPPPPPPKPSAESSPAQRPAELHGAPPHLIPDTGVAEDKPADADGAGVAAEGQRRRDYNGPVEFSRLAPTLHKLFETKGAYPTNRNVLFAAASLKSVSRLLPLACQMSGELRSYVHFALMSRTEVPFEEIRAVNGVDDGCVVFFHDARPDNSSISTDMRLEYSVARALNSIHMFMHPQALIIDGSDAEEAWFQKPVRLEAPGYQMPVVEVPAGGVQSLKWMVKLDSASLKAWNNVNIDILIQGQPGASGSLIRLLKSLSSADYTATAPPHLTIELPQDVDPATEQFLEGFTWPPARLAQSLHTRLVSIRHRVHKRRPTVEESTVRFLESYWPINPRDSHVLVLSPQVQLSPHYFHYLKYAVLEYKHSNPAVFQQWGERLMGISLELPSTQLDGTDGFKPPSDRQSADSPAAPKAGAPGSFLWQAPNSNAILLMGDKWVELHSYVSRLLVAQTKWQQLPSLFGERLVSKSYPFWLEHAARLARLRGYFTLYPGAQTATNLATVHSELYQPPEEYVDAAGKTKPPTLEETKLVPADLLSSLPGEGVLPHMTDMPILAWDGNRVTWESMYSASLIYANELRTATGCDTAEMNKTKPDPLARDLFCDEDQLLDSASSLGA